MSADVINLKRVRKKKAASKKDREAEANRIKFGRTKLAHEADETSRAADKRKLDGALLDKED